MTMKLLSRAFGAALLLGAAATASAQTSGACAVELDAVEAAILAAQFTGNKATSDQSNLLAKLQAAEAKLALAKTSDAVDKLQDISDTATALANAAKPKLADATAINTSVAAAMACVGTLP